jgi:hypothetical protein
VNKYNGERYSDPTAYEALTELEREEKHGKKRRGKNPAGLKRGVKRGRRGNGKYNG